jgi:hypothetical protein
MSFAKSGFFLCFVTDASRYPPVGSTVTKILRVPLRSYASSRRRGVPAFTCVTGLVSFRSGVDFSSKQRTGSWGSYGLAYRFRISSLLSMNSGVRAGMHHIFFPPRLDTPFLQPVPECYGRNILHFSILHHTLL